MDDLVVIEEHDLPNLKKLYETDNTLHAVTTVAIGHFIDRFNKKPEWKKIVKFWSLNDNWRETGTFVMINEHDSHILFNSLEFAPYVTLHKMLQLVNYDKPMVFICFRDMFRPMVLDVIRVSNLEITFDSGTRYVCYRKPEIVTRVIPPEGFYFDSLNKSHVEIMNSMWVQRYSDSIEFLSNCIAQNPSTGLFDKVTGELVAWSIMLETGAGGHLAVLEKYRRKGFGATVAAMQRFKMGRDIVGHIVHQNKTSFEMLTGSGHQWIDNNSWIGIRPKDPPRLVPLWGKL